MGGKLQLKNANWKGGLMWGVLMFGSSSIYQIYIKEADIDLRFWAMQLLVWVIAGLLFAIFTGQKSQT